MHAEVCRHVLQDDFPGFIGSGYLDGFDAREHVELCDGEVRDGRETDGVSQRDEVEPAAAARPACCGAVFSTKGPEPFSGFVIEFGGEGPFADPGGICLADPENGIDH